MSYDHGGGDDLSDVCAPVTICEPNDPQLYCGPDGVLAKPLDQTAGSWATVFSHYQYLVNPKDGFDGEFEVDKYINSLKYGQYYLFTALGTDKNDIISGLDLLGSLDAGLSTVQALPTSIWAGEAAFFSISGGLGDDVLVGAMNADVLSGGDGDDKIGGAGGSDSITGGNGNDTIWGDGIINLDNPLWIHNPWDYAGPVDNVGSANDHLDGNDGDDAVYGGGGSDKINGGAGADHLYGGDGDDDLYGNSGDDCMQGNAGNDWMSGLAGDDTMYGDGKTEIPGDDCMSGGNGDDWMYGDNGYGKHDGSDDARSMGHGDGKEDIGGDDRMLGDAGDDHMFGQGGDDQMDGGEGCDYVNGGDGDDLVDGGAGDDVVVGGDGNDIVRGGLGTDVMYGGDGCDTFAFCEVDFDCKGDTIKDFSTEDGDQIDLSHVHGLDAIVVEGSGNPGWAKLDLIVDGEAVQQILIYADDRRTDIERVFNYDTTYRTDDGGMVRIADGVLVDLASTSVIFSESGFIL